MKPTAALCLLLILTTDLSLAKRRAGLNLFKKIFSPKTKSNTFNQPARPGSYANQGGLPNHQPRQPAGGYPAGGYPAGGYPAGGYPAGGYPAGGYPYSGGYRGYPNPNNRIQSPYLGGGFGYGVYVAGGGSPFSHSVQAMGVYPNEKSKGFGGSAAMSAAQGAVAGMALGYGLGRFPRPHFEFHSPQEEYYYNHYMYRRYGVRSTDDNDYGRDYQYNRPIVMYDNFMDSCVKRMDLLPVVRPRTKDKTAATTAATTTTTQHAPTTATTTATSTTTTTATTTASTTATTTDTTTTTTAAPHTGSKTTLRTRTVAGVTTTSAASTPQHPNKSEVSHRDPAAASAAASAAATAAATAAAAADDDEDTVSIVEIGYPALIQQMKVRRCLELYLVYSEKYLKKKKPTTEHPPKDGTQGLKMGQHAFLAVAISTTLMITNSNMLPGLD